MADTTADNRVTASVFGTEYELEGSLGACKIYADEFAGKLREPYTGNLVSDMLELYRRAEEQGGVAFGDEELYRLAWAMARAAGSAKLGYDRFCKPFEHAPMSIYDWSELYSAIVHGLGDGVFFRIPEGRGDAVQPDVAEEA